ncbi:hypothetical protein KR059_012457 [Drosophila kikkawai]|nr:hypothetical protein KR059_012457 [Drosophila kikkawai]
MVKSKLRSPKALKSLRKSKAKKVSLKPTRPRRKLRSSMASAAKKHLKRSLKGASLPKTIQRRSNPTKLKRGFSKPKGVSRRIKLIDAKPESSIKSMKAGGTSVVFLARDSSRRSDPTAAKSLVISPKMISRIKPRLLKQPKTHEGVDFFYNLGHKVLDPEPSDKQERPRAGKGGLTKGLVGGRSVTGRLKAGGLEAAVAKDNGPKVRARKGIDLTQPMGLEGLSPSPSPVLNCSASLTGKGVVVPLTNRLPIIDFISTTEFNDKYATQKSSRRQKR